MLETSSSGKTHGKADGSGGVSDLCSESSYGFCMFLLLTKAILRIS